MDTWSACIDATVPLDEKVKLTGEIHTGDNLGRFMGGIGQRVVSSGSPMAVSDSDFREVSARGGWIAAALGPWDNMCYNIGYGMEENATNDVAAGSAYRNSCLFGNGIYNFNEHAAVGLEVSWWETEYKNSSSSSYGDGDALVVMASWIYKTR